LLYYKKFLPLVN